MVYQMQGTLVTRHQMEIQAVIIKLEQYLLVGNVGKQNQATNTSTNNAQRNTKQETANISQNVNLKELHLNVEGISPSFNKDILEYYLVVSNFINDIEVDAMAEEASSKVQVTGNHNLQMGSNKIEVTVTSGDGRTSKSYVINVSKLADEKLGNCFLENLAIENISIVPEFSSEVFCYSAEVGSNVKKINILAVPQNENAKVEIIGNDNLQFGENNVEIIVTAEDDITVKKYNILVHKKTKEEEENEKNNIDILNQTDKDLRKHENKFYLWIFLVIILFIVIGIISFFVWKKRK